MELLGCLLMGVLWLALLAGIDAFIALVINWALNSFTQIHPTFLTVFVIVLICSIFFSGSAKKS